MEAQSDFVHKGNFGFELGYLHYSRGDEAANGVGIGLSVYGVFDVGLGVNFYDKSTSITPAFAYHFMGEPNQVGISLNMSYTVFNETLDQNFLLLGPALYYHADLDIISLAPAIFLAITPSADHFDYVALSLGLTIGRKWGWIIRPVFHAGLQQQAKSGFGISLGFIFR